MNGKIPNCMKCKWRFVFLMSVYCGAQGNYTTQAVYDTNKCRELYEERTELDTKKKETIE